MYKKIIIPVDMAQTEKAAEMIGAAKKLADDDAVFILANIVHSVPAVAELAVPQEFFEMSQKEARDTLVSLAKEHKLEAKAIVRIGQPANDILAIAKDEEADLVIVGSHRPEFQDYLLGSTASRVVRHAQCPVLVMR